MQGRLRTFHALQELPEEYPQQRLSAGAKNRFPEARTTVFLKNRFAGYPCRLGGGMHRVLQRSHLIDEPRRPGLTSGIDPSIRQLPNFGRVHFAAFRHNCNKLFI